MWTLGALQVNTGCRPLTSLQRQLLDTQGDRERGQNQVWCADFCPIPLKMCLDLKNLRKLPLQLAEMGRVGRTFFTYSFPVGYIPQIWLASASTPLLGPKTRPKSSGGDKEGDLTISPCCLPLRRGGVLGSFPDSLPSSTTHPDRWGA